MEKIIWAIFSFLIVIGIYCTSGIMVSMMYLLGTLVGTFFGYSICSEKTHKNGGTHGE